MVTQKADLVCVDSSLFFPVHLYSPGICLQFVSSGVVGLRSVLRLPIVQLLQLWSDWDMMCSLCKWDYVFKQFGLTAPVKKWDIQKKSLQMFVLGMLQMGFCIQAIQQPGRVDVN